MLSQKVRCYMEGLDSSSSQQQHSSAVSLVPVIGWARQLRVAQSVIDSFLEQESAVERLIRQRIESLPAPAVLLEVANWINASGIARAQVCRTAWPLSAGCPGGSHEFLEVALPRRESLLGLSRDSAAGLQFDRPIIVELDLQGNFEVARMHSDLRMLLSRLPQVYVGPAERLRPVVDKLCAAMLHSMEAAGLPLPPWRKLNYVLNKWFGRREVGKHELTNASSTASNALSASLSRSISMASLQAAIIS